MAVFEFQHLMTEELDYSPSNGSSPPMMLVCNVHWQFLKCLNFYFFISENKPRSWVSICPYRLVWVWLGFRTISCFNYKVADFSYTVICTVIVCLHLLILIPPHITEGSFWVAASEKSMLSNVMNLGRCGVASKLCEV